MTNPPGKAKRPLGIVIVSVLMILFGLAEIATAFSHNFYGITTGQSSAATYSSAFIGVLYCMAGLVILPMKKWGANLAIALLTVDVLGRLVLVAAGFYPVDTLENTFGIIAGTVIAVVFAIYIGLKRGSFG